MSIKYVGRTTDFCGKTLWEIVSNLRNFGVGRVIVRSMFERYEEKSYMRILKVEALSAPGPPKEGPLKIKQNYQRKVKVQVENVFRGTKLKYPVTVRKVAYKSDWRLLSKKEEAEYCKEAPRPERIIPRHMEFPPLLKEFVKKETGNDDVKLKVKHKPKSHSVARLAKKGETPNVEIGMGIGKPHPTASSLYEGLNI